MLHRGSFRNTALTRGPIDKRRVTRKRPSAVSRGGNERSAGSGLPSVHGTQPRRLKYLASKHEVRRDVDDRVMVWVIC